MKELLAAVLRENEQGNFNLRFHMDDEMQLTSRVDKLLSALIQARVGMQPPVSQRPPQPGEVHEAIFGSGWRIDPDLTGDVAIRFHHPALGWLSWHIPHQDARQFGTALLDILDKQQTPPGNVQ